MTDTIAPSTVLIDVAVGVMLRADGSLLLGQRPEGKPYAGWWELPGGKLEPGETILAALARELHEELGITVQASSTWITHVHAYKHATVRLFFCRVTQWEGEPRGLESQALQWARLRPASAEETANAIHAREQRLAALQARRQAGESPDDLDIAQAQAHAPEEALCIALEPPVGPVLPATLPPLRWLNVPDTYAISGIGAPQNLSAFMQKLDEALAQGLKLLQFREPDWPSGAQSGDLHDVLQQVLARTRTAGARLLVNSMHPLAWAQEADGMHLRSSELVQERPPLAPGGWLGVSAHHADDLARARELDADFAVLGPALPTESHPGAPALGWKVFGELALSAGLPVFALGGQSPETRDMAIQHSAHGIAGIRKAW